MDTPNAKDKVTKKETKKHAEFNSTTARNQAALGSNRSAGNSVGMPVSKKLGIAVKPGWFRRRWLKLVGRRTSPQRDVQQSRSMPVTYHLSRGLTRRSGSASRTTKKDAFNSVCGFTNSTPSGGTDSESGSSDATTGDIMREGNTKQIGTAMKEQTKESSPAKPNAPRGSQIRPKPPRIGPSDNHMDTIDRCPADATQKCIEFLASMTADDSFSILKHMPAKRKRDVVRNCSSSESSDLMARFSRVGRNKNGRLKPPKIRQLSRRVMKNETRSPVPLLNIPPKETVDPQISLPEVLQNFTADKKLADGVTSAFLTNVEDLLWMDGHLQGSPTNDHVSEAIGTQTSFSALPTAKETESIPKKKFLDCRRKSRIFYKNRLTYRKKGLHLTVYNQAPRNNFIIEPGMFGCRGENCGCTCEHKSDPTGKQRVGGCIAFASYDSSMPKNRSEIACRLDGHRNHPTNPHQVDVPATTDQNKASESLSSSDSDTLSLVQAYHDAHPIPEKQSTASKSVNITGITSSPPKTGHPTATILPQIDALLPLQIQTQSVDGDDSLIVLQNTSVSCFSKSSVVRKRHGRQFKRSSTPFAVLRHSDDDSGESEYHSTTESVKYQLITSEGQQLLEDLAAKDKPPSVSSEAETLTSYSSRSREAKPRQNHVMSRRLRARPTPSAGSFGWKRKYLWNLRTASKKPLPLGSTPLATISPKVYQETAPMPSFMNEEHILPPGYNTKNHGDSPTGETSDLPAESNPTMSNLQLGDSLAREKVAGATIFHAAQPKYAQRTELPRRDSTAGFFPKDTMVSPGTLELQQLLLISNLSSLTAVLNQVVVEISQSARDSRCAVETSGAISENLKVCQNDRQLSVRQEITSEVATGSLDKTQQAHCTVTRSPKVQKAVNVRQLPRRIRRKRTRHRKRWSNHHCCTNLLSILGHRCYHLQPPKNSSQDDCLNCASRTPVAYPEHTFPPPDITATTTLKQPTEDSQSITKDQKNNSNVPACSGGTTLLVPPQQDSLTAALAPRVPKPDIHERKSRSPSPPSKVALYEGPETPEVREDDIALKTLSENHRNSSPPNFDDFSGPETNVKPSLQENSLSCTPCRLSPSELQKKLDELCVERGFVTPAVEMLEHIFYLFELSNNEEASAATCHPMDAKLIWTTWKEKLSSLNGTERSKRPSDFFADQAHFTLDRLHHFVMNYCERNRLSQETLNITEADKRAITELFSAGVLDIPLNRPKLFTAEPAINSNLLRNYMTKNFNVDPENRARAVFRQKFAFYIHLFKIGKARRIPVSDMNDIFIMLKAFQLDEESVFSREELQLIDEIQSRTVRHLWVNSDPDLLRLHQTTQRWLIGTALLNYHQNMEMDEHEKAAFEEKLSSPRRTTTLEPHIFSGHAKSGKKFDGFIPVAVQKSDGTAQPVISPSLQASLNKFRHFTENVWSNNCLHGEKKTKKHVKGEDTEPEAGSTIPNPISQPWPNRTVQTKLATGIEFSSAEKRDQPGRPDKLYREKLDTARSYKPAALLTFNHDEYDSFVSTSALETDSSISIDFCKLRTNTGSDSTREA